MALIRSDYAELEAVISRLVNGELTEEDGDRLVTLLRGNAQARAVYLQYESMHAQLSWMFQGQNSLFRYGRKRFGTLPIGPLPIGTGHYWT